MKAVYGLKELKGSRLQPKSSVIQHIPGGVGTPIEIQHIGINLVKIRNFNQSGKLVEIFKNFQKILTSACNKSG